MKLKYSFIVNEVAGQFVAVVVGDDVGKFNGFIKMNDVGVDIFNLLSEETTVEAVAAALKEKYADTPDEEILQTVKEFTDKLKDQDVLS